MSNSNSLFIVAKKKRFRPQILEVEKRKKILVFSIENCEINHKGKCQLKIRKSAQKCNSAPKIDLN